MKHTEEEMTAKAKKVLSDLHKEFYREENLKKVIFDPREELMRGINEGKEHPCWTAVIDEPLFDSSIFLTISDETGEPLYIQNKHGIAEIEKNSDGNYF